jgi:hypothetical protein
VFESEQIVAVEKSYVLFFSCTAVLWGAEFACILVSGGTLLLDYCLNRIEIGGNSCRTSLAIGAGAFHRVNAETVNLLSRTSDRANSENEAAFVTMLRL